jgi:hypothetical protein
MKEKQEYNNQCEKELQGIKKLQNKNEAQKERTR